MQLKQMLGLFFGAWSDGLDLGKNSFMKENRYDDADFFGQYRQMPRSVEGLKAAGEWRELQKLLPDFTDKEVLDLGCGFGWHCKYAVEQGAKRVIGIDLSERMLKRAKEKNGDPKITYLRKAVEDIGFPEASFDLILSSLVFHYIKAFDGVSTNLYRMLKPGGELVFSVEHPVFTAYGNQDWIYEETGKKAYWPVDNYYLEGSREAIFLGKRITKYHRTLTTYINTLLDKGFTIRRVVEPTPTEKMLEENEEMKDELRRPMMLLVAARKQNKPNMSL